MPRIALACSSASALSCGDLDAAGLAAAADLHLGLDHARIADLLGRLDGGFDGVGDPPFGYGDPVAGEELLSLILEQIQGRERVHERPIRRAEGVGSAGKRQIAILPRLSWPFRS